MTSAECQPSPHPPADQAAVVQAVTVIMGIGEAGDPLGGGGEQDPVPGLAGADGQWRPPRWSQQLLADHRPTAAAWPR
jgi:hypothetical protein